MSRPLEREFLTAFWKAHVLHHASEKPVYGLWLLEELAHHGYRLSPGTLYPLLARMERSGLLSSTASSGLKARKLYRLTTDGRRVLEALRTCVEELHHEIVVEAADKRVKARSGRVRSAPARQGKPGKARLRP